MKVASQGICGSKPAHKFGEEQLAKKAIEKNVIKKNVIKKKVIKKTAKSRKSVRREYTKADVRELRAHSRARTPVANIAKLSKRTQGSLRQKALKLGIKLGHRR
jgi:CRISPR/Cas system-associated protein Cas5 (RAMP superfamily)